MNKNVRRFATVAMLAAVYTVVSLALAPISFGNIQIRIAEGLTLLPLIYPPAILGVTLGCFLTNLIGAFMGVNLLGFLDVVVGTLATFLAAVCTYKLKDIKWKNIPILAMAMPVLFNGVIIGIELGCVLFPTAIVMGSVISGLEVAAGELASVIIGYFLLKALEKTNVFKEQ